MRMLPITLFAPGSPMLPVAARDLPLARRAAPGDTP